MGNVARRVKSLPGLAQTAWSIFGITLALAIFTELGLRGAFWFKDRGSLEPPPDRRVLLEGYGGASWPVVHYQELASLADRWEPYVYFRQRPFQGRTINIDASGLRSTWRPSSPGSDRNGPSVKLLMLGGSSLWGFGARDDRTIPSLLARGLHEKGFRAEIRNLAEIGYVSTQEMIALVRELQKGYRPDLVIFYDGVNDTTSALLGGEPTITTNEVNRVREFNLLQSPGRLGGALVWNLVKDSGSYRFAQSVRRRFAGGPETAHPAPTEEQLQTLADGVVEGYLANLKIVESLGREFGFRPIFYWQPVIFSKLKLVPFEHEEAEKYGWTRSMFREVNERIGRSKALRSRPDFHDLSTIVKDWESLVFIDFCHTTESANARIAERLLSDVAAFVREEQKQSGRPEAAR